MQYSPRRSVLFQGEAVESGVESNQQRNRWNVLLFNTKPHNPNYYIVLGIEDALRRHVWVDRLQKANYKDVVKHAKSGDYDLLIAVDGENIVVEVIAQLRAYMPLMALWAFEDPYERTKTTAVSTLFDLVFTNDSASVGYYHPAARHLPLAASPLLDERPVLGKDRDYEFDLSFVGSAWPNRVRFLRRLLRDFPSLKTRIVLSYNEHLPRAYLDMPDSSYVGATSHYDFVEIANRSRINLTLHRDFSGDGKNPRAQDPGPRIFELALAGGFQLIDSADTRIDGYYDVSREVEAFSSYAECVERITSALADPAARIAKAVAAQERTRSHHLYDHRLAQVLKAAVSLRRTKPPANDAVTVNGAKARPRLLFVTHNTIAGGNFGGVEVYQETIIEQLSEKYEVLFYRLDLKSSSLSQRQYIVTNKYHRVLDRFRMPQFDKDNMSDPVAEHAFARVLTKFEIDLVHYHHLINHVVSLPMISKMLGVPSVYTTQDFFLVCTRFNLVDHRGAYCNIANRPATVCDVCLKVAAGLAPGRQAFRRAFLSRALDSIDVIIANSPSARAIIGGIYPELEDRNAFVQLGLPLPAVRPQSPTAPSLARERPEDQNGPLRVVFLGNFTSIKGADLFLRVADALRNEPIKFTICGRVDEPFPYVLSEMNFGNVEVRGGFEPGTLDLSEFDVSLHLSIWPETYCITLSEAWKAGVVPIVSNCGALSDRVTDNINGFIVPIEGDGELLSVLRRVAGDRRALARVRSNINPSLWLTPEQHCEALLEIYSKAIGPHVPTARPKLRTTISTGSMVRVDLIDEPINSSRWDTGDSSNINLPSPAPRLNTLWREHQQIVERLANRSFQHVLNSTVWIDEFDRGGASPRCGAPASLSAGGILQVRGWLQSPRDCSAFVDNESSSRVTLVALRSHDGDVVISRINCSTRRDVEAIAPKDMTSVGFISDPIELSMLKNCAYSIQLIVLDGEDVIIYPTNAVVSGGKRPKALLATPLFSAMETAVVLPVVLQDSVVSQSSTELLGVVDEVTVRRESEGDGDVSLIGVRGWMVDRNGSDCVDIALLLSGSHNYMIPLRTVPRPDVEAALAPLPAANAGYEGAAWLLNVSPGSYRLELIRRSTCGSSVFITGHVLHIAPSGDVHLDE